MSQLAMWKNTHYAPYFDGISTRGVKKNLRFHSQQLITGRTVPVPSSTALRCSVVEGYYLLSSMIEKDQ